LRPQDIIRKKRDGGELSRDEIAFFVKGVTNGEVAEYQVSAWLLAVFLNGMTDAEQSSLTEEMLHSGEILDFSDIAKPKADKHSTGGVGDKTSLLIAPMAAAAGVCVPMISGRGLGHTGGTLDKLESIPGYRVNLSLKEFRAVLEQVGFAMNGQTAEIAPADKKLYAMRDATATVEAIPLIVASIISKKGAAGLGAMVIDVKTGSGAFMREPAKAKLLARALVKTEPDIIVSECPLAGPHLRQVIDAAGVENTFFGSDLGQKNNPTPVEGFRLMIALLLDLGYGEADVRRMVATNAANFIGLS